MKSFLKVWTLREKRFMSSGLDKEILKNINYSISEGVESINDFIDLLLEKDLNQ